MQIERFPTERMPIGSNMAAQNHKSPVISIQILKLQWWSFLVAEIRFNRVISALRSGNRNRARFRCAKNNHNCQCEFPPINLLRKSIPAVLFSAFLDRLHETYVSGKDGFFKNCTYTVIYDHDDEITKHMVELVLCQSCFLRVERSLHEMISGPLIHTADRVATSTGHCICNEPIKTCKQRTRRRPVL